MFERFTDKARRVVVLAQEEAKLLNHNYIGTEHLLLGLIHQGDNTAAKTLELFDVSLESVREQVEDIIGRGAQQPTGHIPFTPRAKKVLELALREALQLGHSYIGPVHILLALIREGEGVAVQLLTKLDVDPTRLRLKAMELLSNRVSKEASVELEHMTETTEAEIPLEPADVALIRDAKGIGFALTPNVAAYARFSSVVEVMVKYQDGDVTRTFEWRLPESEADSAPADDPMDVNDP